MTIDVIRDVILGVVRCMLPIVIGCVVAWATEDRPRAWGGWSPPIAVLLTAAIYWTALIVWLVLR